MKLQQVRMLAVGLIVVFPILLVLDVMGYRMMGRTERTLRAQARAAEILRAEARTAAALTLSEFAGRQALAYQDGAALDAYRTARESALTGLGSLKAFAAGDASLAKAIGALGPLLAQEYAALDQRIESRDKTPAAAAYDKGLEAKILELGNKSREQLDGIRSAQENALASYDEEASGSSKRAVRVLEAADALALWSVALAALLVFRDTQRRQWRGVERRMHSRVLETLPLAVLATDDHGIILYSNPAAHALFEYPGEDLLGRHVSALEGAREASEERHRAIDEQLAATGSWAGELETAKRSGVTFRCAARATRMDVSGKFLQLYTFESLPETPAS
jgi:PAS domain S-box-containing protein